MNIVSTKAVLKNTGFCLPPKKDRMLSPDDSPVSNLLLYSSYGYSSIVWLPISHSITIGSSSSPSLFGVGLTLL